MPKLSKLRLPRLLGRHSSKEHHYSSLIHSNLQRILHTVIVIYRCDKITCSVYICCGFLEALSFHFLDQDYMHNGFLCVAETRTPFLLVNDERYSSLGARS